MSYVWQELPPLSVAIYRGAAFTLKKYPVTSFLWLLGLVLMFFATGLSVSEEVISLQSCCVIDKITLFLLSYVIDAGKRTICRIA